MARFAALFALLLGCGGDSTSQPDADAGAIDGGAGPTLVQVRVVSGTQPAAGVPVVFQRADGSILETSLSGQGGLAVFELPPGGMVTVVPPAAAISTFSKVQPGDSLTFDVTPRGRPAGVANISLPGEVLGANRYAVETGCGTVTLLDPNVVASIAINSSCVTDSGHMASVAVAFEVDVNGAPIAVHAITATRDQPVDFGATFRMPAWAPVSTGLEITPEGSLANISAFTAGEVVENVLFTRSLLSSVAPVTVPFVESIADQVQYQVLQRPPDTPVTGGVLAQALADFHRVAPNDAVVTYNTATNPLPVLTEVSIDVSTLARPVVHYGAAAPTADLWVATATWATGTGPTRETQSWDLIAPAQDTTVTFPELPEFLESSWSPPDPNIVVGGALVIELSEIDGYDAARTGLGFSVFASSRPPLGGPGSSVRVSLATFTPTVSASSFTGREGRWAWGSRRLFGLTNPDAEKAKSPR